MTVRLGNISCGIAQQRVSGFEQQYTLLWAGYAHLAQVLYKGLAIPPSAPAPPAPPAPPGVWVYQNQGLGKLFIPAANFTANKNSGRAGKLGWDACAHGANGTRFDNGVPLWPVSRKQFSTHTRRPRRQ